MPRKEKAPSVALCLAAEQQTGTRNPIILPTPAKSNPAPAPTASLPTAPGRSPFPASTADNLLVIAAQHNGLMRPIHFCFDGWKTVSDCTLSSKSSDALAFEVTLIGGGACLVCDCRTRRWLLRPAGWTSGTAPVEAARPRLQVLQGGRRTV